MNQHTPAQVKAIQGWTEQRDALLREIGLYAPQLEELKKSTVAEGQNLAALHVNIAEARGRLAELTALEERHKNSVSNDVSTLELRKTELEGIVSTKEAELKAALDKHSIVTAATEHFAIAHDNLTEKLTDAHKLVHEIVDAGAKHLSDMKTVMVEVKGVSDGVIAKSNENIAQTGIILEKLPRYIFELQKPIHVRRVFAAPAGTVIAPETT